MPLIRLFKGTWNKEEKPIKLSKYVKASMGGFSGMLATVLLHPLDVIKTRMQIYPHRASMYLLASMICRCESPRALYLGLPAAIMRQSTYTTTRIAVYHWLYEKYKKTNSSIPAFKDKVVMGMYASMIGAFAGGPSDIVLVRMMSDARKDPCTKAKVPHRRRYTSTLDCFHKMYHFEGFTSFWRGGSLSLARAACVGIVQIGSYTQETIRNTVLLSGGHLARILTSLHVSKVRGYLQKHKLVDGNPLHVITSFTSGCITAVVTLPIDRIKVRYQVRRDRPTYMQIYKTTNRCGIKVFWAGFLPYFLRLSVHTSLTYILMQKFTDMYQEHLKEKAEETEEADKVEDEIHQPLDYSSPELQNFKNFDD